MTDGRDLWNPVAILGGAGTLGLLVSARHVAHRWIAPGCLLAVLLAAISWSGGASDEFARATFTVSLIWGVLLTVLHWNNDRRSELPLQFVLLAGLCLMSQAGDIIPLFLGLQIVSLGTSMLTSSRESAVNDRGFPLSWLLLLGFVLLASVTGATRLETIQEALQTSYAHRESAKFAIAGGGSRVLMLASVFIGTALAGYAVCAPIHFQFTDQRPQLTSLLLPRVAALLAWVKLWPGTISASESTAQLLIGVLATITCVVPLLQARAEQSLVRQWWLLTVAQGGWLLLAIAAWSFMKKTTETNSTWSIVEWNLPTASQAAWLSLLLDGVAVIGLSGVLTYLRRRERSVEFVDDLRGLIHFEPIAAVCACVCLLSLSGLPVLAGFWSRLFVAMAAMNVRGEWGPSAMLVPQIGLLVLTAFVAWSTVWSVSIAIRSVWVMLFGMPLGQARPIGAVSSLFSAVLASILLIGCGLLPGPLLSWLCAPRVEQQAPREPSNATSADDSGGTR